MRYFYLDYENVKDSGLNGVAKLSATDIVKIFYSEDAQRISFGTHRRIIESQASFEYQKLSPDMKTLKNALDFLIIHDLEVTMKTDKSSEYYIVSKDNDYDGFIEEKIKKKYKINKIAEICKASNLAKEKQQDTKKTNSKPKNQNKETELKNKEQAIRSYIGRYLKEYNSDAECKEGIVRAYLNATTKQQLHNNLQKEFVNDAASYIFSVLKNSKLTKSMPGK